MIPGRVRSLEKAATEEVRPLSLERENSEAGLTKKRLNLNLDLEMETRGPA